MLRMCLVVWAVFLMGPFGEADKKPCTMIIHCIQWWHVIAYRRF